MIGHPHDADIRSIAILFVLRYFSFVLSGTAFFPSSSVQPANEQAFPQTTEISHLVLVLSIRNTLDAAHSTVQFPFARTYETRLKSALIQEDAWVLFSRL